MIGKVIPDPNAPIGKRILLVDDEVNLLDTLALILIRAGYDVRCAKDAEMASRILQNTFFGLVFLDLRLIDADGLDLLDSIHQSYPDTSVVILTGHPSIESEAVSRQKGAKAYLNKPIDPLQIIKCVQEILEV